MVIFQYNLYIFVWIQHGCLNNTVYAMDRNNSVIKKLWCTLDLDDIACNESSHHSLHGLQFSSGKHAYIMLTLLNPTFI